MKHSNISIFVTHIGCPHRCSFCDQVSIAGSSAAPIAADVDNAVMIAAGSGKIDPLQTEIAFFGGSFTAIEKDYMLELLDAAYKHVKSGVVSGIRVSTRPDAISPEILKLLKDRGVTAIELGAQSMNDEVLSKNLRGHSAADVASASALIKEFGFSLGLQMMTGLYTSTPELDIKTALDIIALSPDTVRIYPTIILKGTALGALWEKGEYETYSLSKSVELCAKLLDMFEGSAIKVIRLGLHSIEKEKYLSGPWHPAFRELCESERYFLRILNSLNKAGRYVIYTDPRSISKVTGQNKNNLARLFHKGFDCKVVADKKLRTGEIKVIKEESR